MKKLFLVAFLLTTLTPAFSQTETQIALVDKFFNKSGGNILQDAAHTACTWSYATIKSVGEHTYSISLRYTQVLTSKEFSCEYILKMNNSGKFLSIVSLHCHTPNVECFGMCELVKSLDELPDKEDGTRYETFTGKRFDNLSCEEFTNAKLFFAWNDNGYYSKY